MNSLTSSGQSWRQRGTKSELMFRSSLWKAGLNKVWCFLMERVWPQPHLRLRSNKRSLTISSGWTGFKISSVKKSARKQRWCQSESEKSLSLCHAELKSDRLTSPTLVSTLCNIEKLFINNRLFDLWVKDERPHRLPSIQPSTNTQWADTPLTIIHFNQIKHIVVLLSVIFSMTLSALNLWGQKHKVLLQRWHVLLVNVSVCELRVSEPTSAARGKTWSIFTSHHSEMFRCNMILCVSEALSSRGSVKRNEKPQTGEKEGEREGENRVGDIFVGWRCGSGGVKAEVQRTPCSALRV